MANGASTATSSGGLLGNAWDWLTTGFGGSNNPGSPLSGLGNLLGGITGTGNPLADIFAIISFINEGEMTQEQAGFIKNLLDQQTSAVNTAMDPNKLSAYRTAETPQGMSPETFQALMQGFTPQGQSASTLASNMAALTPAGMTPGSFAANMGALTPQGMSPGSYGDIATRLTGTLSQPFIANALNPVTAQLAASGQNESAPVRQYVSEQALAPYALQLSQMGQEGANQMVSQGLQEQQFGYGGAGQLLNQYLTEQGTGASFAKDLLSQYLTEQQTGFAGAGDFLNQLLTEQGLGANMSQFGLSLPRETPYAMPNFGYVDPSTANLLSLLTGTGGANASGAGTGTGAGGGAVSGISSFLNSPIMTNGGLGGVGSGSPGDLLNNFLGNIS